MTARDLIGAATCIVLGFATIAWLWWKTRNIINSEMGE